MHILEEHVKGKGGNKAIQRIYTSVSICVTCVDRPYTFFRYFVKIHFKVRCFFSKCIEYILLHNRCVTNEGSGWKDLQDTGAL